MNLFSRAAPTSTSTQDAAPVAPFADPIAPERARRAAERQARARRVGGAALVALAGGVGAAALAGGVTNAIPTLFGAGVAQVILAVVPFKRPLRVDHALVGALGAAAATSLALTHVLVGDSPALHFWSLVLAGVAAGLLAIVGRDTFRAGR